MGCLVGLLLTGASVSAHNLDQRMTYVQYSQPTLELMKARAAAGISPLIQPGDPVGLILKSTPGPGTLTGVGGYMTFYIENGLQVIHAEYGRPDPTSTDGFRALPMKGQSIMPIGSGPVGAKVTSELIGFSYSSANVLGTNEAPVTATGLARGTVAGVYADTGIFYSTNPKTAFWTWVGGGGYDGNPSTSDNVIVNNRGEAIIPNNLWDSEQLLAYGSTSPIIPIIDYGDGRGNAPWGLANVVAGPESGYAWQFNWSTYKANGGDLNKTAAMKLAVNQIGPWNRVLYPGSQVAADQAGLVSSTLGYAGVDASTLGRALTEVNPLPADTNAVRFSYGMLELGRAEYAHVIVKVTEPLPTCFVFNGDAFGGDAGGEFGGKDHEWRYYDPTLVTVDCTTLLKTASKDPVIVGESFTYTLTYINAGVTPVTNLRIVDPLPAGISLTSVGTPQIASGGTVSYTYTAGPPTWVFPYVPPSTVITIPMTVTATTTGTLWNTATGTSDQGVEQATESVTVGLVSLLRYDKTVTPAAVAPGGTVTYTITVTNDGTGPNPTPLVVADMLPAGFTYVPVSGSFNGLVSAQLNGALLAASLFTVNATNTAKPIVTVNKAIDAGKALVLSFRAQVSATAPPDTYYNTLYLQFGGKVLGGNPLAPVTVGAGRIGDTVYRDWDGDGTQDSGEEGIAGIPVQLYASDGTTLLATTTTDANGAYLFQGLTAGTYVVKVNGGTGLSQHTNTGDPDGGTANQATVTLGFGEGTTAIDFGYYPGGSGVGSGTIQGTVFEDLNGNNTYLAADDGEIPMITVDLYEDSNGNGVIDSGDLLVATTVSDSNGAYSFPNLATGLNYLVDLDETDPDLATWFTGTSFLPVTGNSDPRPVANLASGTTTQDFGYRELLPASIGDQVYIDANANGTYDSGDTPLAGVTVSLYRGSTLVGTTTSGPDGTYLFDGLSPDTYTVVVNGASAGVPAGYAATLGQYTEALSASENYTAADFAFVPLISKTVDKAYAGTGESVTFSVTTNYPGEEHLDGLRVIDPLPSGLTYSSATAGGTYGAYSSQSGTPGEGSVTTSGLAVYSVNTATPEYRLWDGTEFDASGTTTTVSLGAFPNILTGAAAPTRDEKIVVEVINSSTFEVRGMLWNGTSWTPLPVPPSTTTAGQLGNTSSTSYWGGAVAYEQSSGDAVLVWNNGTTGTTGLTYNVWNGTAWTTNGTITAPVSGEPYQMRLAAKPGADEMVLVVSTSLGYDYALVWNGSSWGNSVSLDSSSGGALTSVQVAYEQQSGRAMVVYGKASDVKLYYRLWNGTSWTTEASVDPTTLGVTTQPQWVAIAADPTSNRIAVGAVSSGGKTWLAVWSGSAWGSLQLAATSLVTTALDVGVAFETVSGDLLAVYGKSGGGNTVYYRTWTSSGGWTSEATGADVGGQPNVIVLARSPNSDRIVMTTNDSGSDANLTVWDGSAWGTALEATATTGLATGQPALFLWDQHLDPASTSTLTASPITAALNGSITVQLTLRATKTIAGVTPTLTVAGGTATCTTTDTIPADVLGGVTKTFTYTCTPTSLGEIRFEATAQGTSGYTFSAAESNTVLVSNNAATNLVTWDLGSTVDGVPGTTASKNYVYGFRGAATQSFRAYNFAGNDWTTFDPTDTPAGVTIKEGGALTNDGKRYIYALRGNTSRVFLRYDTSTDTWDDTTIADLPGSTDKAVLKGGALVYLNGYVYAFLGNTSAQFWRYDVAGNSWTQMANAPAAIGSGAGLTTDGTSIFGTQGNNKKGFWRYNVGSNTWTARASTLDNFSDGGCLVFANEAIYALRGGTQKNFYRYNLTANTWTRLTSTPGNIDDGGAIVFNGQYLNAFQGKTTTFYRYDLAAGTWTSRANAPWTVGWGGALTYLASGNVTHSSMQAYPTLVTDSAGDQTVTVYLTLTGESVISNITAGTLSWTGTNSAAASGTAAATLVSADDDLDGTATDAVVFKWVRTVTAGTIPGAVTFSADASSTSPTTTFATAASNSVIVTPVLTYTATVNAGAPSVIANTAVINEFGGALTNVPSNTTETATTGSLGDRVWLDTDADGVQDSGELGLAGVRVYVDSNNNGVWDTGEPYDTTDAYGLYRIYGLSAATYTVRTDPATYPTGYLPTTNAVTVALSANQQYADADFGLRPPPASPSTITGNVWLDADEDGVIDASEADLSGVTVRLYHDANNNGTIDAGDVLTAMTTTDADGSYTFAGLYGDDYLVQVDTTTAPAGTELVYNLTNPRDVTLGTGATVSAVNFGFNYSGSIAGTVFYDFDGDGVLDAADQAVPNGAVVLVYRDLNGDGVFDEVAEGAPVAVAFTSGGNGGYLVDNLMAGTYFVSVYSQSIPNPGSTFTTTLVCTTGEDQTVPLAPGEDRTGVNFGFLDAAMISGTLFHDIDRSGTYDPNAAIDPEYGLRNVTVWIDADNDGVFDWTDADSDGLWDPGEGEQWTATDAAGEYRLLVQPGTYTVRYLTTDPDIPSTLSQATTGTAISVTVEAGYEYGDNNFGRDNGGSISGTLVNDDPTLGTLESSDPRLAGVVVTLYEDANGDGTIQSSFAVFDGRIDLIINGAADGSDDGTFRGYRVIDGYLDLDRDGSITSADDGHFFGVVVIDGQLDLNGDGAITAADDGVTPVGETALDSVITDSTGAYSFAGLADTTNSGQYLVQVETASLPTTVTTTPTLDPQGAMDSKASLTLSGGATISGQNFGYPDATPGTISGHVYEDAGAAGFGGDVALAGVLVTLYTDPNGDGNPADGAPVATAYTDGNGLYTFSGIRAGNYVVVETDPYGGSSVDDRGGDTPGADTDNAVGVILSAGETASGVDFLDANVTNPAISGQVRHDLDADGSLTDPDSGMAGVTIRLFVDVNGDGMTPLLDVIAGAVDLNGDGYITSADDGTLLGFGVIDGKIDVNGDGSITSADDGTALINGLTVIDGYIDMNNSGTITGDDVGTVGTEPLVATQTTDGYGDYLYSFSGAGGTPVYLVPGMTYVVVETDYPGAFSTNDASNDPLGPAGTDNQVGVSLGFADSTGNDFLDGMYYTISGHLYNDANGNGTQDVGEANLSGVAVLITDAAGGATIVYTDANGNWTAEVPPGSTTATVYTADPNPGDSNQQGLVNYYPNGFVQTQGTNPTTFNVTADDTSFGNDGYFGTSGTASISGTVYNDTTENNAIDTGTDGKLPGVLLRLYQDTDADGVADRVTVIDGLIDLNGGGVDSTDDGTLRGVAIIDGGIDLNGDGAITAADVGTFLGYQVIAGKLDLNDDGAATGADDGSAVTEPLVTVTATDANGAYAFSGLAAGNYVVVESDPLGATSENEAGGSGATVGSVTDSQIGFTLTAGLSSTGNHFLDDNVGLYSVSGKVTSDTDADGDFSSGDTALSGVTVAIYADVNGDGIVNPGEPLLFSTLTATDGSYAFSGLPNGRYVVVETDPSGVSSLTDSDGTAVNGANALAVTVSGSASTGNNFLDGPLATLSGTVVSDSNRNGTKDSGETGINGVTITLVRDLDGDGIADSHEPVVATTTTASGGTYSFTNVPVGNYVIVETEPYGYTSTGDYDGGDFNAIAVYASGTMPGLDFLDFMPIPTAAVVSTLRALLVQGVAVIEWETVSEAGSAAFRLWRLPGDGGTPIPVGDGWIAALGQAPGGIYRVPDPDLAPGQKAAYQIEELEGSGAVRTYGPFAVKAPNASRAGALSLDALSPQPRPVPAEKEQRAAARLAEERAAGKAGSTIAGGRGDWLRIPVTARGLHYLSRSAIAAGLGYSEKLTANFIVGKDLQLFSQGQPVDYLPAGAGTGLYFFGEAYSSPYTTTNVYWLRKGSAGLATPALPCAQSANPPATAFRDSLRSEQNTAAVPEIVHTVGDDFWFWKGLLAGDPTLGAITVRITPPALATVAHSAELVVRLYGATDTAAPLDHSVKVSLNGTPVGTGQWDGQTPCELTMTVPSSLLLSTRNSVTVTANAVPGVSYGKVYLDWLELRYLRRYEAAANQLEFSAEAGQPIEVKGFTTPDVMVLAIADPKNPALLTGLDVSGSGPYAVRFVAPVSGRYVATVPAAARIPTTTGYTPTLDLERRSNHADYLLVTVPALASAAKALVDYRALQGLTAAVVTLDDVQFAFGHGLAEPTALRDFLAYACSRWRGAPRYVLLAGDGTYDYLDRYAAHDNLVPPLLVGTPFGLVASDSALSDVNEDGAPEVAIGRLPVMSAAELSAAVQRLVATEAAAQLSWPTNVLVAADVPDAGGDFVGDSNRLLAEVLSGLPTQRLYMTENSLEAARTLLQQTLGAGTHFVTYAGHGGFDRLQPGGLLTSADVPSMVNAPRLPILTAATCVIANFAVPGYDSLGEALLLGSRGGAAAVWAPGAMAYHEQSMTLVRRFYEHVVTQPGGRLGDAVLDALATPPPPVTGLEDQDIDGRRWFGLLGDPAMVLP